MSADLINPGHYRATLRDGRVVEVADLLEAFLPSDQFVGWCRASAVKYLLRAGAKHGEGALVEYRKGAWFINRLVEHLIAIEASLTATTPSRRSGARPLRRSSESSPSCGTNG